MTIDVTTDELKTLKFYLEKAKIDVEGAFSIGIASKKSVDNIYSLIRKCASAE